MVMKNQPAMKKASSSLRQQVATKKSATRMAAVVKKARGK